MATIDFEILYIPDPTKGRPLFNGQVYVGNPGTDPTNPANQKQLRVVEEDGSLVNVSQPFSLSAGGVPVYNGSPVRLDVSGNYSIKILSSLGAQVYYISNAYDGVPIIVDDMPDYVSAEFASVAAMKNGSALNLPDIVDFADYVGRKVSTVVNNTTSNSGGAEYIIKTEAQRIADGDVIDGYANHYLLGGSAYCAILVFDSTCSLWTFGGVTSDATINTAASQAYSDYLGNIGGGIWYIPPTSTPFPTNEDITFGSKTTIIMDGFMIRDSTAVRSYDCMMLPAPGAENVRFDRVLLDCNNVPAISGGIFRRNNRFCSLGYGYVKNAATDASWGGGRGWIIEDGVTDGKSKMSTVGTLVVKDSFNGFGFAGGFGTVFGDRNDACNVVENLILENVECPVGLFGNTPTYPHDGQDMSLIIKSVIARNCGKITSTSNPAITGIIDSIRASNVKIESFYLQNDSAYMVGATSLRLWDGEYKNCHVDNAVIDCDLQYIVRDGATAIVTAITGDLTNSSPIVTNTDTKDLEKGYSVTGTGIPASTIISSVDSATQFTMSAPATATNSGVSITASGTAVCKDSSFKVQVNGTVSTDLILCSTAGADHLLNNIYDFTIDKITTDRLVPSNINAQTSNYLFVRSKEHGCFVFGKTGTGSIISGFTVSAFAGYMGQIGSVGMSDVNGGLHYLKGSTTGYLTFDDLSILTCEPFTVAGVPSAATNPRRLIFVSNEVGGSTIAFSDGTNWRRVQDRAIIS